MTNQEQINEIMEKIIDLPQPPILYEDDYPYPWKPFKSNGGETGDTPPSYNKPTLTVETEYDEPVKPKLCPFRKNTYFYTYDGMRNGVVSSEMKHAEFSEEEFQPCLQFECMLYELNGPDGPSCGRR